jgi:hypothetical protein
VSIEAIVHQAFAKTELPPGALFATEDDEGARAIFTGARWEDIEPDALQRHSAAVNFLSPSAFAYFLPALILASLSDAGVRDSLVTRLLPPKDDPTRPSFASWWELLSHPQRSAAIAFVDHCNESGCALPSASIEALKSAAAPNKSLERTREG